MPRYNEFGEVIPENGVDEWGESPEQITQYKKKAGKSGLMRALGTLVDDEKRKLMLRMGMKPEGGMTKKDAKYVKEQRKAAGLAAGFRQKAEQDRLKRIATIASSMKPAVQSPNFSYNFGAPQFGGR